MLNMAYIDSICNWLCRVHNFVAPHHPYRIACGIAIHSTIGLISYSGLISRGEKFEVSQILLYP